MNTTKSTMTNETPIKQTKAEKQEQQQLCWNCQFATGCTEPHAKSPNKNGLFTCPWATEQQPVPGWTATLTQLKVSPTVITTSYVISKCPYYKPDLGAKIEKMPLDEVAKKLGLSAWFVRTHIRTSRHILYLYVKRIRKMKEEWKGGLKPFALTTDEVYDIKREIVEDVLDVAKWELEEYDNRGSAQGQTQSQSQIHTQSQMDDTLSLAEARRTVAGCEEMLMALAYQRKKQQRELKRKESLARLDEIITTAMK